MPLSLVCSVLSSTKNEYIFGFDPTNSSIATPLVSSFILPVMMIEVWDFLRRL